MSIGTWRAETDSNRLPPAVRAGVLPEALPARVNIPFITNQFAAGVAIPQINRGIARSTKGAGSAFLTPTGAPPVSGYSGRTESNRPSDGEMEKLHLSCPKRKGTRTPVSMSLRASAHTGVAISHRIIHSQ